MTPIDSNADVFLRGVFKAFGGVDAVNDVTLAIQPGSFFSLVGPSGCGKTTTLRLIAGFEQPSKGEVYIRGKPMAGVPPYRRDYGMVFQNLALFPHLTIAKNVAFGLRMHGVSRHESDRRVREALALVKLSGMEDRYPQQISGGQQQRVALARAIVVRPAVLLLDEPLGSLDKKLREEMQIELRELQHQLGTTAIFVTHDQEEALTMSDRIAVMNNGKIIQVGAPREVYERPATEFIAGFLGVSNMFEGVVVERLGNEALIDLGVARIAVPAGTVSTGERIRLAIRPEKIQIVPAGKEVGLPARICKVVYRGVTTQIYADCGEHTMTIYIQNISPDAVAWRVGDEVVCQWEKDSAVILDH